MKKRIVLFATLIFSVVLGINYVKAESAEDIFAGEYFAYSDGTNAKITDAPAEMTFSSYRLNSESRVKVFGSSDPLGVFAKDPGWEPFWKYTEVKNKDGSTVKVLVFCVGYHSLAPTGKKYSLSEFQEGLNNDKKIAYIIKKGFDDYQNNKDKGLAYYYYAMQLAIWKVQNIYGFEMSDNNPFDASTDKGALYKYILELANNSKIESNWSSEYITVKYTPSDKNYQEVVPGILFETIKKETPKTYNLGLEYLDYCTNDYVENATIKVHSGNSCSGSEIASFTSKDTKGVSGLTAGTYTVCDVTNNISKTVTIDNKDVVVQMKSAERSCENILIKASISYKDKCTNKYIEKAAMKLFKGGSCSGTTIKSWTSSNNAYTIDNIDAGTYTICDTTNNVHKTINIANKNETQNFEMYNNPATCDETKKSISNPKTGVIGTITLIILISGASILYMYSKKKNYFKLK